MILVGSMLHALTYIMSESILTRVENPIAPEMLCALMGAIGCVIYGSWQIFYTIPHFKTVVLDEVESHHGQGYVIITSYIVLVVVNLVHAICFFKLLSNLGSTSTGVMKGIQSVLVFVISHFAFCSLQASQCFTPFKGLALVIVVSGVFFYSYFHLPSEHQVSEKDSDGSDVAEVLEEYSRVDSHHHVELGTRSGMNVELFRSMQKHYGSAAIGSGSNATANNRSTAAAGGSTSAHKFHRVKTSEYGDASIPNALD
jgi:hypothetical protein